MEIKKTKSGERFKEKVRLPTGKLMTKTFRRKTDAVVWKRMVETQKAQGALGINVTKTAMFEEVAQKWFKNKIECSLAYSTVNTYRHALNANVLPNFAGMKMDKISLSHIEDVKAKFVRAGLKANTINRIVTMIRQIFLFALDEGNVNSLPFKKSLLVKKEKGTFQFFEDSEVKSLLRENRNSPTYPILFLALHTGMRLGEITGLCWDRVNFTSGKIEITRTLQDKGLLQEKTKGGNARYFPMNEELRNFFMTLRKNQTDPKFVFTNKIGKPFNGDHFSGRNFKVACERARVRKLRFHDLRHTFASHFMMKGGNIFDLKMLLGHSDIKTTMVYAHLSPNHLKEASRIVNFGEYSGSEKATGPSLALAVSGN